MAIKNFKQLNEALSRFVPPKGSFPGDYNLDKMRQLMDSLGNPQDKYSVIHIAGTSGKTSTAYYISALLGQTGAKVGLTVSPHVDEVNERVQINLKPIAEAKFCEGLEKFINLVDKKGIKPSYFELLVAYAYYEFARAKVDYAVVEVGLGGLLDGTNVVNRPDKICVITDIGLDHTKILGNTLAEIAGQKAGIIQPGNEVFTLEMQPSVIKTIREVCLTQKATLHEVEDKPGSIIGAMPSFQQRNWLLAREVVDFTIERDNLTPLNDHQLLQSTKTYIPARMEIIRYKDKILILDGAHNAQKMEALVGSIKDMFNTSSCAVMVSFSVGKIDSIKEILKILVPLAAHITITGFNSVQDAVHSSVPEEQVATTLRGLNIKNTTIINDPKKALNSLLKRPEELLIITGSFYLVNHIRPVLGRGNLES